MRKQGEDASNRWVEAGRAVTFATLATAVPRFAIEQKGSRQPRSSRSKSDAPSKREIRPTVIAPSWMTDLTLLFSAFACLPLIGEK